MAIADERCAQGSGYFDPNLAASRSNVDLSYGYPLTPSENIHTPMVPAAYPPAEPYREAPLHRHSPSQGFVSQGQITPPRSYTPAQGYGQAPPRAYTPSQGYAGQAPSPRSYTPQPQYPAEQYAPQQYPPQQYSPQQQYPSHGRYPSQPSLSLQRSSPDSYAGHPAPPPPGLGGGEPNMAGRGAHRG